MSNQKDRARAVSGHVASAPSDVPRQHSRSASIASTTSETDPHQLTPKPRSTKQKNPPIPTHTAATGVSITVSRPGSRASSAPLSAGGGVGGGSAYGAVVDLNRLCGEGVGEPEEIEEGEETLIEANTSIMGITTPLGTPATEPRSTSEILAGMGLRLRAAAAQSVPTLVPALQNVHMAAPAVAPVYRQKEIEKDRQNKDEHSPDIEARERRKRRQEPSWTRGVGDGPSLLLGAPVVPQLKEPIPGLIPKITRVEENLESEIESQEYGNKTRGETYPRLNIDNIEQMRIDFALMSAIRNDKVRSKALLDYEEALTRNGGREDANIFKIYEAGTDTQEDIKKERKKRDSKPDPVTPPKNKANGRLSLGTCIQDLEGERWTAHTPVPMPYNARNRGLPSGGYLHDRLMAPMGSTKKAIASGGDPSDSSKTSSSSDSDSDYRNMNPRKLAKYIKKLKKKKKEKKQKQKLRKLQLSGFKTMLPTTYDGSSDFDVYEQFVYEVETWVEDTGFEDYEAVRHIKGFLKDKAAIFYMSHVAPEVSKYTLTLVFQELFNYCFPPDIKAQIRYEFNNMVQMDSSFRDFYRELRKIQRRLTDINDKSVAIRMWEGAHSYLRIEWARNGYSAEHHTPEELEESAIRFENAEKIRQTEENGSSDQEFTSEGEEAYQVPTENRTKNNAPETEYLVNNNEGLRREKVPRLSPERFAEYRAAGKCTFCDEVGHIAKDCPKRNFAIPKRIRSSAINFARINELEDLEEDLQDVYSVSFAGIAVANSEDFFSHRVSGTTTNISEGSQRNTHLNPSAYTHPQTQDNRPAGPKGLRTPLSKHTHNHITQNIYSGVEKRSERRISCQRNKGRSEVEKMRKRKSAELHSRDYTWKKETPRRARLGLVKGAHRTVRVELVNAEIAKGIEGLPEPFPMVPKGWTPAIPYKSAALKEQLLIEIARTKIYSSTLKPIEPPIGEGECKDRVTLGHRSEAPEPVQPYIDI